MERDRPEKTDHNCLQLALAFSASLCYTAACARGISTVGSARHSHCRGQGFDSPMLHKQSGHPSRVSGFVYADMECPHPPAEDYATHWRGAGTDDCQWQKYHQCQPQPIRSELPSGQSRLYRLRNRGSTTSPYAPPENLAEQSLQGFFIPIFSQSEYADSARKYLPQRFSFALYGPETSLWIKNGLFLVMEVAGLFWGRFWLLMR